MLVQWTGEVTHTSECIAHIIPSHRPLLALHHFVLFPSEGILKIWFGTPGLGTYNIDLSTAQRTFPTDQRKSGLPKVLPAYKNGLRVLTHGHLNVFLDDSHKNDKKWLRTHLDDISLIKTNWCLRSHLNDSRFAGVQTICGPKYLH